MNIKFKVQTILDITIDQDANYEETIWNANDIEEVTILNETKNTIDIQFGDGTIAFNINKDCLEFI